MYNMINDRKNTYFSHSESCPGPDPPPGVGRQCSEKRGICSLFLIAAGTLLLLGSLTMVLYDSLEDYRAGSAAEATLRVLEDKMASATSKEGTGSAGQEASADAEERDGLSETALSAAAVQANGYGCIGILTIPSLDLRLPVLDRCDELRLKTAPCLYSGSWQDGSMVICGHNCRRHFSPIKSIRPGTEILFETVDGQVIHYAVSRRETVQPQDISAMTGSTQTHGQEEDGAAKDWDLTLFTCNTGGRTRCAVRCVRK